MTVGGDFVFRFRSVIKKNSISLSRDRSFGASWYSTTNSSDVFEALQASWSVPRPSRLDILSIGGLYTSRKKRRVLFGSNMQRALISARDIVDSLPLPYPTNSPPPPPESLLISSLFRFPNLPYSYCVVFTPSFLTSVSFTQPLLNNNNTRPSPTGFQNGHPQYHLPYHRPGLDDFLWVCICR